MRHLLRAYLSSAVLFLAVCAFTLPSFADTQHASGCSGCNGYTFQATLNSLGGGNFSLSYTITNVSGALANSKDWSLTLFSPGAIINNISNFTMSDSNQSAYKVVAGKANNGNADCNAAISAAVCVDGSGIGTLSNIALGKSLTFSFDFSCSNCTELANWDFLAAGTCEPSGKGNCYAISLNGTGGPVVPEPSSIALFGSGLLTIGTFLRHKSAGRGFKRRDSQLGS